MLFLPEKNEQEYIQIVVKTFFGLDVGPKLHRENVGKWFFHLSFNKIHSNIKSFFLNEVYVLQYFGIFRLSIYSNG